MAPSRPGWLPELPEYLKPVALIAEGVYGQVLRAEDTRRGRAVAVRVLKEAASGPSKASRLEAANRLSTIDHSNLAAVYEVATYRSSSYIELELVEGASLADRLKRAGALPFEDVLAIGRRTAAALAAAHAVGVIHGDLNPANVLFNDAGELKVIDFRFLVGERSSFVPGHPVESPEFLSPEYLVDAALEPSSDVYSLGVILYHSMTGRLPFGSEGGSADVGPGMTGSGTGGVGAIAPPNALMAPANLPAIPSRVADFVARCLAPRPDARFATAAEFTAALDRLERALEDDADGSEERVERSEATTLTGAARDSRGGSTPGSSAQPSRASTGRRVAVGVLASLGVLATAGAGWVLTHPLQRPATARSARALTAGAAGAAGAAAPSRRVVLRVESEPDGALVYFRGGAVLGRTPTDVPLERSPAARELVVRFADGEERALPLTADRATTVLVHANLLPPTESE